MFSFAYVVSPRVIFIHIDCWTVFNSVYLLGINAVVVIQAGQLTDPEYRAIPSLVAAVVAMVGIPVIPQFRPHEEVSDPDDYPVFSFCSVCICRFFFLVSDSVLRIRDTRSSDFLTPGSGMEKIWILDGKIRIQYQKNSDPG
jgi:hypothetical protein